MKLSLITLLSASALVSAAPFAEPEPMLDERQAAQSIDAAMKAKGRKYFGTCTDPNRFNTGSNGAIIKANFGQVTPENSYVFIQPRAYRKQKLTSLQYEMGPNRDFARKLQLWHRRSDSQVRHRQWEVDPWTHYCVALAAARMGFPDQGQGHLDHRHPEPRHHLDDALEGPDLRLGRAERDLVGTSKSDLG
jgi:hypothetical protein